MAIQNKQQQVNNRPAISSFLEVPNKNIEQKPKATSVIAPVTSISQGQALLPKNIVSSFLSPPSVSKPLDFLEMINPNVKTSLDRFGRRFAQETMNFLGQPVELFAKTGTTIGNKLSELVRHQPSSEQAKKFFEKPEVGLPTGAAPFENLQKAGVSALKATETLSLPFFGAGRTLLERVATRSGIGLISGLKQGLENAKNPKELIAPIIGAITIANGVGLIDEAYLGWKKLASLESELNKAIEAVPGKPVKAENIAQYVDNYIGTLNGVGDQASAIKRLTNLRDFILDRGDLAANEAQAIKRDIYRIIKTAYGKEASAAKTGLKLQALGLKEEVEKAVPVARNMNKIYKGLLETKEFVDSFFMGKEGGLKDIVSIGLGAIEGGFKGSLTFLLGRRLTGMALLKGLEQRLSGEAIGVLDRVLLPIFQGTTTAELTSPDRRPPLSSFLETVSK